MKKIIKLVLGLIMIVGVTSCALKTNEDALKFKEEYESLNGEKINDKEIRKIKISSDNPMKYYSAAELLNAIDNKETFIVYFGFSTCPWCRSVLPTLLSVSEDENIDSIYYVDIKDIRDTLTYNEETKKVETTIKGSEDYYSLLKAFENVAEDYLLTDSEGKDVASGEKRIYAPSIVAVVDGVPKKLTTGISSKQTDAYMKLTEDMLDEMEDKIEEVVEVISAQGVCEKGKGC